LPAILSVVGPLFAGVTVLTLAEHVKNYLELGWAGQIRPAGKSLSKALAAGAIELISWLTFKVGSAALRGAKAAVKAGREAALAGLRVAKAGVALIRRGIGFLIKAGKVLFRGIARSGIGRAFK